MIKKLVTIILFAFCSVTLFAQTKKVTEKKLVQTLEDNKKADVIFVSEISLDGFTLKTDGAIELSIFKSSAISLFTGMDMSFIKERLAFSNKKKYKITIETKGIVEKSYCLTNIEGIETVSDYKARLERERKANIVKQPVQVVSPTLQNITSGEQNWLGGQVQDKLKSNLQDYLGLKIVVDAKSESALKKVQQESESESRDEDTAIEIGKITTAKFALFTNIRKTNRGYSISADFTDLTTGEQFASAISKEYVRSEYLYGITGAVDEMTLLLADKLGIQISDIQRKALENGTADFTVDAQLALALQNEVQYQKLLNQYDEQLTALSLSTDLNTDESKRKIEAEKVLLAEKQKTEEKRRIELENQKRQAEADSELEAQRSIELKTRRDELAKQAEAKAKEIRKLVIEKQGVLGEINVIENKKKTLVEIRKSAEQRCIALHEQYTADKKSAAEKIKNKPYASVELEDGEPTQTALQRRENQIIASNEALYNKFIADAESVKKAIAPQENALLSEIRTDQKGLEKTRTVSSLGEELKVRYGDFSGEKEGWNTYISLYSEGVLLYNGTFILSYESIVGKKAPNLATELNDAVINEYANNVDMHNSLFARGTPLLQFELDYTVKAESDDKPSEYCFDFKTLRVMSVTSGKVVQSSKLDEKVNRVMKPEWNIANIDGIVEKNEKARKRKKEIQQLMESLGVKMVIIPDKDISMLETEVTQKLYATIMGINPSKYKGALNPVDNITWYNAIDFCNRLSEKFGFTPVYSSGGLTDVSKWKWAKGDLLYDIVVNQIADGFRLPTKEEWEYGAKGGQDYKYAGSDSIEEVAWSGGRSKSSQPVAQKKANGYGLYDMSGNVYEWVWDAPPRSWVKRYYLGGCWNYYDSACEVSAEGFSIYEDYSDDVIGFRIVRAVKE